MKVTLDQCKTPTCRGCGRKLGFEHYKECVLIPERPKRK